MKPELFKVEYTRTQTRNREVITETVDKRKKLIDRFGRAFSVGQMICYPVRKGSHMSVEVGEIWDIEYVDRFDSATINYPQGFPVLVVCKPNGNFVRITRWDRAVVVNETPSQFNGS